MIINISYETFYNFSSNVPRLVQSLMLYPTDCSNQKVISCEINTNLGELVEVSEDALGHKLYNIYNKNISEQQIYMKCTVETKNTFGIMKGLNESVHPNCFLRQTTLTKPNQKILSLIKKKPKKESVEFCHLMNETISNSIDYVPGATNIHTSAVDAIDQGKGVCQDFSHILVGLARSFSYPSQICQWFSIRRR